MSIAFNDRPNSTKRCRGVLQLVSAVAGLLCLVLAPSVVAKDGPLTPIQIETILIPAGNFVSGSDRQEREMAYQLDEVGYGHSVTRRQRWYENEFPRQEQSLPAFSIMKTVVPNVLYRQFVTEAGHRSPQVKRATWEGYQLIHPYKRTRQFTWTANQPPPGRENHPVVMVSLLDAQAFASWLSKRTGRVWMLPSEAQWEKAARGTDGRYFPWGNVFEPTRLNSHDRGPFTTVPVGQYSTGASPFGLLDAAGQVFEWTSTRKSATRSIVKGGSWDDTGCGVCRPAARHSRPDDIKHILVGFRLVTTDVSAR